MSNPINAYKKIVKDTLSGREIEAAVLIKAAEKLQECQQHWNSSDRDKKLDESIKFNQLIWSIFQSELASVDNPLPKELRANLLRLSAFIDKRSLETIAYPASEKLNILININRNIAAGLRERPQAA
ncbi:MAG TPA: flagellar biosynthesis regulatory protein FlaF [Proteobacteria bacterium]|nr:flagellar biosynthesis regulatory protein FlaF [Pseudomonadota bacterium]